MHPRSSLISADLIFKILAWPRLGILTMGSSFTVIMILESMKMEIPVLAPGSGTIASILVEEGTSIVEGQAVATLAT